MAKFYDASRFQAIENELENQAEELKADSIKKETRVGHLEGKCQELSSSLEKAKDEAIETFKTSDKFTKRLDEQYAAVYEDFHSNAKEAYPEMDFDVFKVPIAAESFLIQMSSKDVKIMDDASTEPSKDDPKSRDARSGL